MNFTGLNYKNLSEKKTCFASGKKGFLYGQGRTHAIAEKEFNSRDLLNYP